MTDENTQTKLRCEISSDINELERLNALYHWIPNSVTIRPTPEVLAVKNETMRELHDKWQSLEDFILFTVFGVTFNVCNDKFFVADKTIPDHNFRVFKPNDFPYSIPDGNHWVLWYGSKSQPYSPEKITEDIRVALSMVLGGDNFDFAWYINPKMSVPDFFHVQVFWIKL